jgi:hypothetical protein
MVVSEEVPEVYLVEPSPTPECQELPGVSIEIHMDNFKPQLTVRGLQPVEKPHILYSAANAESGAYGDLWSAQGANEQGVFNYRLQPLEVLEGDTTTTWQLRVVHARGVACASIQIP